MSLPAILALEDGSVFRGKSIGYQAQACGEVVFNTSITGYQEILTDPSYAKQIITLTHPHIGNVGTNSNDEESSSVVASGLVIKNLSMVTSNWRSTSNLSDYLSTKKVVGIADIDTRRLTRLLREKGALNGCIQAGENIDVEQAIQQAKSFTGLKGADLAREVTTDKVYQWTEGSHYLGFGEKPPKIDPTWHIVAYDFGVKRNILRILVDLGCKVTVVPATTSAEAVVEMQPDGVFLSNGPGDPEPCQYAIAAIKTFLEQEIPLFGICLGHQLLSLACGAKTLKMKFGHHGGNHPVQCLATGRVMITSQNHGFAVDESTLPSDLKPTHKSLFDQTLQGIAHKTKPAYSFQGHPEASPGPHEAAELFAPFIQSVKQYNLKKLSECRKEPISTAY